jgi:hypothetical protein
MSRLLAVNSSPLILLGKLARLDLSQLSPTRS